MVQDQAARIESQVLHAVLLIHVIEDFRRRADVVNQLRPRNAGQVLGLTLAKAVAHVRLDEVGKQNDPAGLGKDHFARHQRRVV